MTHVYKGHQSETRAVRTGIRTETWNDHYYEKCTFHEGSVFNGRLIEHSGVSLSCPSCRLSCSPNSFCARARASARASLSVGPFLLIISATSFVMSLTFELHSENFAKSSYNPLSYFWQQC